MAWQLIYTSAPRLLDAGLTGFGTIARHRAIPPLVVKAVERISQFARLPGYPADRVIFSHRLLTVGGARFHVLSRLRDAGSDYSGRTNHIAHHLVVSSHEAAQLGPAAATPADILLGMGWLDRWEAGPEWLPDDTAVPLQRFIRADHTEDAWQAVTGHADCRWLLINGKAARGSCLIHPANTNPLRLIAAAQLGQDTSQAWQSPFTSCLQQSDEPQEFRWIGIAADSPLRSPMESSGRPVLDLTCPASLPRPELPAAPLPTPTHGPGVSATPAANLGTRYAPPPPTARTQAAPATPSHLRGQKTIPLGSTIRQPIRRFVRPALVGITAAVAGTAAFLWFSRTQPTDSLPEQKPDLSAIFRQVGAVDSLDALRRFQVPESHSSRRLEMIERIVKLKGDADFKSLFPFLTAIQGDQTKYREEDSQYDYSKDSVRRILESAALKSLEQSGEMGAGIVSQLKEYPWLEPGNAARAQALINARGTGPSVTPVSATVVTPPTVAPAPTPKPTPAPPAILRSQFSIVSTFDELKFFAGPDHNFWDSWKSRIEIRRNGKPSVLVAQGGGTRFTEEGKVTSKILEIKGPEFEFAGGARDDIETVILENGGIRWEITIKPPVAPKLPAEANLKWIPGEAVFEFTGKAREAIESYKLNSKQSLSFKLDFQEPSREMESIPVLKGRTESRKPFLDALRQQVSAKLEEDPEYLKLRKDLDAANQQLSASKELDNLSQIIAAEKGKNIKDNMAQQRALEEKAGIPTNSGKPTQDFKDKLQKRIAFLGDAIAKREIVFGQQRVKAETHVKQFDSELPYGGVGKVYIVPSGSGSGGLKGEKPIFEIVAP